MPVLKSSGVNVDHLPTYGLTDNGDVIRPLAAEDLGYSTLHLGLDVTADMNGVPIHLISSAAVCGSGCRRIAPRADYPDHSLVEIVRFAKDGNTKLSLAHAIGRPSPRLFSGLLFRVPLFGVSLSWLVTMEDGHPLTGWMQLSPDEQSGELSLSGRMFIHYKVGSGRSVVLASRKDPTLSGAIAAWPPKNATRRLTNGPIEYFAFDKIHDMTATPILTVRENVVTFGSTEVNFLTLYPRITHLADETATTVPGVRVEWTPADFGTETSERALTAFDVYRRFLGDDTNGWVCVGRVPYSVTSFLDHGNRTGEAADYCVLHAASYGFDYSYECLPHEAVRFTGRPSAVR